MFFFQAEDGIRDLVRSRGLGDVYKRQGHDRLIGVLARPQCGHHRLLHGVKLMVTGDDLDPVSYTHLTLPTSDLV